MNKNTPRPTSIRIFLADSLPEGLKIRGIIICHCQ